jgi:hypothetical protein
MVAYGLTTVTDIAGGAGGGWRGLLNTTLIRITASGVVLRLHVGRTGIEPLEMHRDFILLALF